MQKLIFHKGKRERVILALFLLLSIAVVSCEDFILGSAVEGETVDLRVKIDTSDDQIFDADELALTSYLTVDKLTVNIDRIQVFNPSSESFQFAINNDLITLHKADSDKKIAEKILPQGEYDKLRLKTKGESTPNAPADSPDRRDRMDDPGPKKNSSGLRVMDNSEDSEDQNSSSRFTNRSTQSFLQSETEQQESSFSLKIEGRFRGNPFVYTLDEDLDLEFDLNPMLEVQTSPDTVTVLKVLFDYSRWFSSGDQQEPYLDPNDVSNRQAIEQNIRSSIHINRFKGNEEEDFDDDNAGDDDDNDDDDDKKDKLPKISVNDMEVSEGHSPIKLPVKLSEAVNFAVSVDYATSDVTAESGKDYGSTSGTLTLQPGETERFIEIPVFDDSFKEDAAESFDVAFSDPVNGTLQKETVSVTILDNDDTPSLSVGNVEANEGEGVLNFTVEASSSSSKTITVDYATEGISASRDKDFKPLSGTLSFSPGSNSKVVSVEIMDDEIKESVETLHLKLSNSSEADIADSVGVGKIMDNDQAAIAINNPQASEGDGNLSFIVSLNIQSDLEVSVDYHTADSTATVSDGDYEQKNGTLTFAPGETQKTISVGIIDDLLDEESKEHLKLNLTNPQHAILNDDLGVGTILDDESPPSLSIQNSNVSEDAGSAQFDVELSIASKQLIKVDYTASEHSARSGSDFAPVSGSLVFKPGEKAKTISIPIIDDEIAETEETYFVNLSNPSNATIDVGQATGIIEDNDQVSVQVNNPSAEEADGSVTFLITLGNQSDQIVKVDYQTADHSAESPQDYTGTSGTLTFNPGETSKSLSIDIHDDQISENEESFLLNLMNPVNAILGDSQGEATINDNDGAPSLSVDDVNVSEGDGTLLFTVALSIPSTRQISIDYSTTGNTATSGADFNATSGSLQFNPGETQKEVSIPILEDEIVEETETFFLDLSNPVNAGISDERGIGTIVDNDEAIIPDISVSDVAGPETSGQFAFELILSEPSNMAVKIDYTTEDGSALSGEDYTLTSGGVTFSPGEVKKVINVPVLDDTVNEPEETFTFSLSNPENATINDGDATAVITDDDDVNITISDAGSGEGDGTMIFDLSLDIPSTQTIHVDYSTKDGSAISGSDYTPANGTLTFDPGTTTGKIEIDVNDDAVDESDETFELNLSNPVHASISGGQAIGTITDNDSAPSLSIGDASGSEGSGSLSFDVTLSTSSGKTVTVDYATGDGSAAAGSDYTAASGTLSFAPGVTSKTITVPVTDDTADEPDESFSVTLSNASNASISDGQATGTITDNDEPASAVEPDILVEDVTASESEGSLTFTVQLSEPTSVDVSVDYATFDNSAKAGEDYVAAGGTLEFIAGVTSRTITVVLIDDDRSEKKEQFDLMLSNAVNAKIKSSRVARGVINDDDSDPSLSIGNAAGSEGSGSLSFDVTLSTSSGKTVTVDYATGDGSAAAGSDYTAASGTLSFAPGVISKTITVPVTDDTADEPDESFSVTLSNASNASISDGQAIGTIIDNDEPAPVTPTIQVENSSAGEGDGFIFFDVTLSESTTVTVTVEFETFDNSAKAGQDYVATSGTLSFTPGETTQQISVELIDDNRHEPGNQQFDLRLSNPENGVLSGRNVVQGQIQDNDTRGSGEEDDDEDEDEDEED